MIVSLHVLKVVAKLPNPSEVFLIPNGRKGFQTLRTVQALGRPLAMQPISLTTKAYAPPGDNIE